MSDAVITAIIMTVGTIICQILINRDNRIKRDRDDAKKEKERAVMEAVKETRLDDRLSEIERKLDSHNGYAQKFQEVADRFTEIAGDLSSIKTSIDFIKNL